MKTITSFCRARGFLAAVSVVAACRADNSAAKKDVVTDVPTIIGSAVWVTADRADAPMSSITRMVVDAKQRVFAPDLKEAAVFVFGADGAYLTRIGRKGSGPGEFDRGCCGAIDSKGRLWIKDAGNARYVVFSLTDANESVAAKPAFVVSLPHQDPQWGSRVWFDSQDNVISVGHATDTATHDVRAVKHFFMDSAGRVTQTAVEPPQTDDVTQPVQYTVGDKLSSSTIYLYQPFGAQELRANGPNGAFAVAGSGKYSVRWFSPAGALLHTLTQDAAGPELSIIDRVKGDSQMVGIAKDAHTTVSLLPFKLPSRKPPLASIFFDADGRLWVQLTTADNMVQQADVYGTDGALAFHAAWPAGIRIANNGFVRGNTAWGVQLDDNDVPHIVRMEFR